MPHTYECPLRWADMDLLGHVNNVTYVDYLTEAREAMFAGHPAGRAPVSRLQVEFVAPLVFRRRPVLVDTWVTAVGEDRVELAQEVYDLPAEADGDSGSGSGRTVHLRATTVLDLALSGAERAVTEEATGPAPTWRPLAEGGRPTAEGHELHVRRSDIGEDGLVRPGVFLEYFQEARIRYLMDMHTRGERWSHHVVARTDVDLLGPVAHRRAPYAVTSWVSHLGSRSFTIRSEMRDGERVVATATVVMVVFDPEAQTTAEMTPAQRARLVDEVTRSGADVEAAQAAPAG